MKILNSKTAGWLAFLVVITVFVITFKIRTVWWGFFDIFFAFMMVFCHVISLAISKYTPAASKKLEKIALIMGILTVIALAVEGVAFSLM